jgi:hypothetical protein
MANRISRKDLEAQLALLSTGENVKAAAAKLGISRQALHERLGRKPHLRPELSLDRATVDKICASVQMLESGVDLGEWWAVKQAFALMPQEKTPRPPRPTFSDEEVEDLILMLGGDLEAYWATKEKITASGKPSLRQRRITIEIAAAVTLQMPCNQVWGRLKTAWVDRYNRRKFAARLNARISGLTQEGAA